MIRLTIIFYLLLSVFPDVFAQRRCGTTEYMLMQRKLGKIKQSDEEFEEWLRNRSLHHLRQLRKQEPEGRQQSGPYRIPVVVHVIHNGEPVGTGANIPDEQIFSQMNVINKDFRRLNADAALTPPEFAVVAGTMDIQFVLALRDPDGLPTTGIVRINGGRSSWSVSQEEVFKALSYWPSEHYLNIWVLRLIGGYVGYAQFPVSTLPGLEDYQDGAAHTDGIVIDHRAFGSIDDGSFNLEPAFNKGRTLTHEIGHFFGLRHIWGDAICGNDYVDDTPLQRNETLGCPTHPSTTVCGTPIVKMFQNYMDYTNDACMNLFTQGQVARMQLILEDPNVPRRNSLLTSPGLLPPDCSQLDVAILDKRSPGPVTCNDRPLLQLTVRSLSCDPIHTLKLRYAVNGSAPLTTIFTDLNLMSGATTTLSPGTLVLQQGYNTVTAQIVEINGLADANPANSTYQTRVLVDYATDRIPLRERFSELRWPVINPSGGTDWEIYPTNFSTSASFRAHGVPDGPNEAWLTTPVLDFSHTAKASMFFDLSYAWNGVQDDRLRILISTDCGDTYTPVSPPFDRKGLSLANAVTSSPWQPENETQWQLRTYVKLNALAGAEGGRVAFVFTNQQGNNLYLDNIEFFTSDDPNPVYAGNMPFSVYWTNNQTWVTFNLEERSNIRIDVIDINGRIIATQHFADVLNQTFPIETGFTQEGIYLFRVLAGKKSHTVKFFLKR